MIMKKNYWNNNQQNNYSKPKKKSGCKSGKTKEGLIWISGWNVSRSRGLMSFIASPNKKQSNYESKSGNIYVRYVAKVRWQNSGVERVMTAFYNPDTRKLYFPELSMVASLNTRYFGTVKVK